MLGARSCVRVDYVGALYALSWNQMETPQIDFPKQETKYKSKAKTHKETKEPFTHSQ